MRPNRHHRYRDERDTHYEQSRSGPERKWNRRERGCDEGRGGSRRHSREHHHRFRDYSRGQSRDIQQPRRPRRSYSPNKIRERNPDWKCSRCQFVNFGSRESCKRCSKNRYGPDVPEALMAAQWCSNAPRQFPKPMKKNFLLDKESGWKYDPATNYYVVDEDKGIFYDGVTRIYLVYDEQKLVYEQRDMLKELASGSFVDRQGNLEGTPRIVADEAPPLVPGRLTNDFSDTKAAAEDAVHTPSKKEAVGNKATKIKFGNLPASSGKEDDQAEDLGGVFGCQDKNREPMDTDTITFEIKKKKRFMLASESQQGTEPAAGSLDLNTNNADCASRDRAVERARASGKVVCLLCRRAFKKPATYERHLVGSYLHKSNLERKRRETDRGDRPGKRRRVFKEGYLSTLNTTNV